MANPVIPNLDGSNPGPAGISTINTQSQFSTMQFEQTIAVTLTPLAVTTSGEQSFGANGVSYVSAATGIKTGDIIVAVSPPAFVTGVTVAAYRVDPTVNDKFYLDFIGTGTPASGVWLVTVCRYNISNSSPLPTSLA